MQNVSTSVSVGCLSNKRSDLFPVAISGDDLPPRAELMSCQHLNRTVVQVPVANRQCTNTKVVRAGQVPNNTVLHVTPVARTSDETTSLASLPAPSPDDNEQSLEGTEL